MEDEMKVHIDRMNEAEQREQATETPAVVVEIPPATEPAITVVMKNEQDLGKVEKALDEETRRLKHYYIRKICGVCGNNAVFMPRYNQVVCASCLDIDLSIQSDNYEDYLTPVQKAALNEVEGSRFALRYQNPRSNPLRNAPGRNEPCLCGSGKKFKKCCLDRLESERNDEAKKGYEYKKLTVAANLANQRREIITAYKELELSNGEDVFAQEGKYGTFHADPAKLTVYITPTCNS